MTRMFKRVGRALLAAVIIVPALGWDAHGHRIVTYAALQAMPDAPDWLRDPAVMHMIADQSTMPDRWRATRLNDLTHENGPDHYVDVEALEQYGLSLGSLPRLRREYLKAMILAAHEHPERITPYDPAADPPRQYEWPGFAPYAVMEHYGKLRASFHLVRILEALDDPARSFQLDLARANAIYHMGVLSHFVGDLAQPLHTTIHHHGWVGPNPHGYTTDRSFHALIDGGVLRMHDISLRDVRPLVGPLPDVRSDDPWEAVLAHLARSFAQVEPLYRLEQTGDLRRQAGADFIRSRLADGAAMLAALYAAAWAWAEPTDADVANFLRYDVDDPNALLQLDLRTRADPR